jgi:hypothetical protein
MHSILVVFVILLAILMLISALGGSLNLQEKFEEEENNETLTEMFYELPKQAEEKMNTVSLSPPSSVPSQPPLVPPPTQTVESFMNEEDIEPFEEDEMKFGSPL